jgi:hypothetical protein
MTPLDPRSGGADHPLVCIQHRLYTFARREACAHLR